MSATATGSQLDTAQRAGKYLTFVLGDEEYGLEILKVREIISLCEITGVPRTPDFIRGVINLRGKVIPVVDLRRKFDMDGADNTDQSCIIVVDVDGLEIGILVDKVSEVREIAGQDIENAPEFGSQVDTGFILGMGKADQRVIILLNISKVLTDDELSAAASIEQSAEEQSAE